MSSRWKGIWLLLAVLAPGAGSPASGQPAPADSLLNGQLFSGWWRVEAYSGHVQGSLLWLRGPQEELRVELGRQEATSGLQNATPRFLLERRGEGWTLVRGGDGRGTLGAWGREWRPLGSGLGALASLLAEQAGSSSHPRGTASFIVPALVTRSRSGGPAPSFRLDLVHRGRGRGGPGEMLHLRWLTTDPHFPGEALEVRSTKRPGRLLIGGVDRREVAYPYPEAFVPLWSLGELLGGELSGMFSGNPGGGSGVEEAFRAPQAP